MSGLTRVAGAFVSLATRYGNASIKYIKGGATRVYEMVHHPVTETLTPDREETDQGYRERLRGTIPRALARAQAGERVEAALRAPEPPKGGPQN